jgi:type I restriction enzyme R subunit
MWALLDKSKRIIKKNGLKDQFEIKAAIRSFLRFYCFLIQVTSFQSIDLHKKYNYLNYLIKELDISAGNNDFDVADKIVAEGFRQKKTGEVTKPKIEGKPEVRLPKPDEINLEEEEKKKLSQIIEEINLATGTQFDLDFNTDTAIQYKNLLMKDEKLKASANANSLQNFSSTYYKQVDKNLLAAEDQREEFADALLNNEEMKKKFFDVFMESIYRGLRSADAGNEEDTNK